MLATEERCLTKVFFCFVLQPVVPNLGLVGPLAIRVSFGLLDRWETELVLVALLEKVLETGNEFAKLTCIFTVTQVADNWSKAWHQP